MNFGWKGLFPSSSAASWCNQFSLVFHTGAQSELAAVPSPSVLLAQHYLHASAAKLSHMALQSQAKTSSFGNSEGAHGGKVSLEMSERKGEALAFLENQENLEASQVLILLGSSLPDSYPFLSHKMKLWKA